MTAAPVTGAPPPARPARLRGLDGLRFAAAAGVILYHFTARSTVVWGEPPGERFPVVGHISTYFSLAPELFFVLSGFVILWTAWGRTVPAVIASRAARLYPAYWAALALTSLLLLVVWPEGKNITPAEVAVNVTLLQAGFDVRHVDGVYWTLWAELRFYALVVVLVAIGLTRRRVLVFAAVWPVAAVLVEAAGWQMPTELLIGSRATFFAGGMLLFLIYRDGHAPMPWLLLAGNAALAVVTVVPAHARRLTVTTVFDPSVPLLAALAVGCFVSVAVVALTPLRRLDWAVLSVLGALTYPLYLVHMFWGRWVILLLHDAVPDVVTLAAAIAVCLALAWVVHHGVEKRLNPPMRRLIEDRLTRLTDALRGRARRAGSLATARADRVGP